MMSSTERDLRQMKPILGSLGLITAGIIWSYFYQAPGLSLGFLLLVVPVCLIPEYQISLPLISFSIPLRYLLICAGVAWFEPGQAVWAVGGIILGSAVAGLVRGQLSFWGRIPQDTPAFFAAWITVISAIYLKPLAVYWPGHSILILLLLKINLLVFLQFLGQLLRETDFRWGKIVTGWKGFPSAVFQFLWLSSLTLLWSDYCLTNPNWGIFLVPLPLLVLAFWWYQKKNHDLSLEFSRQKEQVNIQTAIIEALMLAIDAKHRTTPGHSRRVEIYSLGIARSMGIQSEEDLNALKIAAMLHDIGELGVPDYLLSKPGKLSEAEFSRIVRHTEIGANLLEPIKFPYPIVQLVRHHHERVDGNGYPYGLKGDEIPLGARILAVAESFDALTTLRPYKKAISCQEALSIIREGSGRAYDSDVVAALMQIIPDVYKTAARVQPATPGVFSAPNPAIAGTPEELKLRMRSKSIEEISSVQREVNTLHEMFQTIGSRLNVNETLQDICEILQTLIPFNSCVVYLKDGKAETAHAALAVGQHASILSKNWVHFGEGATGYAIVNKQPVINVQPGGEFKNLILYERPEELVKTMVFPLHVEQNVLGAISLYSDNEEVPFTEDHVRLMEMVCSQTAISIQNAQAVEAYERNSLTDALTGLPNSRYMFLIYEQNVKKADRFGEEMAVLVMDLNGFKSINDKFGHKVGDEVLIAVSQVLQKEMRKYDSCIRYGGDEFVAFLYNSDRNTARVVMDRIRQAVRDIEYQVPSGEKLRLGISIGAAFYPEDGAEMSHLFTVADYHMYKDKKGGNVINGKTLPAPSVKLEKPVSNVMSPPMHLN
jgi:diguanylate cyclase (GGDEF)-like protein/putative nucleotidyltransferase with HDIG domain